MKMENNENYSRKNKVMVIHMSKGAHYQSMLCMSHYIRYIGDFLFILRLFKDALFKYGPVITI